MARFQLSSLIAALPEAENGAWGPPSNVGSSLNEVPYAPYSKGDKLGRMADWTNENAKDGGNQRGRGGYNRNYRGGARYLIFSSQSLFYYYYYIYKSALSDYW